MNRHTFARCIVVLIISVFTAPVIALKGSSSLVNIRIRLLTVFADLEIFKRGMWISRSPDGYQEVCQKDVTALMACYILCYINIQHKLMQPRLVYSMHIITPAPGKVEVSILQNMLIAHKIY